MMNGEQCGRSAAKCYSMEFEDEDMLIRLMPVPDGFCCPMSLSPMSDPVATVDGHVYERVQIERWIRTRRQQRLQVTSPVTGLELASLTLLPLRALQESIQVYLQLRPELKGELNSSRSFAEAARALEHDLVEKEAVRSSIEVELARLQNELVQACSERDSVEITCAALREQLDSANARAALLEKDLATRRLLESPYTQASDCTQSPILRTRAAPQTGTHDDVSHSHPIGFFARTVRSHLFWKFVIVSLAVIACMLYLGQVQNTHAVASLSEPTGQTSASEARASLPVHSAFSDDGVTAEEASFECGKRSRVAHNMFPVQLYKKYDAVDACSLVMAFCDDSLSIKMQSLQRLSHVLTALTVPFEMRSLNGKQQSRLATLALDILDSGFPGDFKEKSVLILQHMSSLDDDFLTYISHERIMVPLIEHMSHVLHNSPEQAIEETWLLMEGLVSDRNEHAVESCSAIVQNGLPFLLDALADTHYVFERRQALVILKQVAMLTRSGSAEIIKAGAVQWAELSLHSSHQEVRLEALKLIGILGSSCMAARLHVGLSTWFTLVRIMMLGSPEFLETAKLLQKPWTLKDAKEAAIVLEQLNAMPEPLVVSAFFILFFHCRRWLQEQPLFNRVKLPWVRRSLKPCGHLVSLALVSSVLYIFVYHLWSMLLPAPELVQSGTEVSTEVTPGEPQLDDHSSSSHRLQMGDEG